MNAATLACYPDGRVRCVLVSIPLEAKSAPNLREHWAARHRRVQKQRWITQLACGGQKAALKELGQYPALHVALTRVGKRLLDDDNVQGALKAVRDELAKQLGRDDGPCSGIRWSYRQAQGKPAVNVLVEVLES